MQITNHASEGYESSLSQAHRALRHAGHAVLGAESKVPAKLPAARPRRAFGVLLARHARPGRRS
jgi:hypothetical protein